MSLRQFIHQNGLRPIGQHHVFVDRNGNPVVIRQETKRSDFQGDGFEPSYMDGDFGGRQGQIAVYQPAYLNGEDDGDFVGEFADEYGEFGRGQRQTGTNSGKRGVFHHGGGGGRRVIVTQPSAQQNAEAQEVSHVNIAGAIPKGWCATVLSATQTLGAAGNAQVAIRLQHDFLALDVAFDGSQAAAKVIAIQFGDRLVWSNPTGVPVTVFSAGNFIRNLLNGQRLSRGLDITVTGSVGAAGDFVVTMTGAKPYAVPMGS